MKLFYQGLVVKKLVAIVVLAVGCLTACGGNVVTTDVAYFDLGSAAQAKPMALKGAFALRSVDVQAPSWLATSSMQYRLAYADGSRRQAYGESRWAAPPAELVEAYLRRTTASDGAGAGLPACRLRVDLDEFIQVFDGVTASRSVVEVRIALMSLRGDSPLARRTLSLSKAARTPDARGGVEAFAALSGELSREVEVWLARLLTENPQYAERCKGGA